MLPQPALEYFAQALSIGVKGVLRIHGHILHVFMYKYGLESHRVFGNLLVAILVDEGYLHDAHTLFDKLVHPNNSSLNTLISGFINVEKPHRVIGLYQRLQNHVSLHLSAQNFVALLKACAKIKDLERCLEVHGEVARLCMEDDVFVGSTLVDMYSKFGSLAKAQQILNKLSTRNVVSWNALMAGYAKHGHGEEALQCFDQMQLEGMTPDSVSYLCGLKACGIARALVKGRELHAEIERKNLLLVDAAIGNTLVDMYVKCGSVAIARQVFDRLPTRNVVTWTNLIAGLAEHGDAETASRCFEQMQAEGISPDAVAVVCGLKACRIAEADDDRDEELDVEMEEEQAERRFAILDPVDETNIPCMSLKRSPELHHCCSEASQVAEHVLRKGSHHELERVHSQGIPFSAMAPYYSEQGQGNIDVLNGENDLIIGNTLVDVYAKRGALRKAQKIFDSLLIQDQVSWNILIAGYAEHGYGREALKRFEQMQLSGFHPDVVTYVCILKACGTLGALEAGLKIHSDIAKKGLLEADLLIGSTLVDMYAKCGSLEMSHQVFDMLPVQNVVSWTSLMAGYTRHGFGEEAIKLYDQMQPKGVSPDVATVVSLLKACINIGATDKGREIHAEIERRGFLERDLAVGNALVDMYAKCGSLTKAQSMFDNLPLHDVVSWNSLIAGYVGHGRSEEALEWFAQMQFEGVSPDAVTYASSLQAFSKIKIIDWRDEILAAINGTDLKGDFSIGNILVNKCGKGGSLLVKASDTKSSQVLL